MKGIRSPILLSLLALILLVGVASASIWQPLGICGLLLVPLVGISLIDLLDGMKKGRTEERSGGLLVRFALGCGVGLSLAAVVILILAQTRFAYDPLVSGGVLTAVICLFSSFNYFGAPRSGKDEDMEKDNTESERALRRRSPHGFEDFDKYAGIAMVILLVGSIGAMGAIQIGYEENVELTRFYLTDTVGGYMGLPQRLTINESCEFAINVEMVDSHARDFQVMVVLTRNVPEYIERDEATGQVVDTFDENFSLADDATFVREVHLEPGGKEAMPFSCSFTINGSYSFDCYLIRTPGDEPYRNLKLQIFVDAVNLLPVDLVNDWVFTEAETIETILSPHDLLNKKYYPSFMVNVTNESADVITITRLKEPIRIDPRSEYEIFGWNMSDNCTGDMAIEVLEEDINGSLITRHILQPFPLPEGHRSSNWTRFQMFLRPSPSTWQLNLEITLTRTGEVLNGTVVFGKLNIVDTKEVFYLDRFVMTR